MKRLRESKGPERFPRCAIRSIECRSRDLVIRIADWTRQSLDTGEPAYDVECYIGGIYDFNESRTFGLRNSSKTAAKKKAINFAKQQVAKLL